MKEHKIFVKDETLELDINKVNEAVNECLEEQEDSFIDDVGGWSILHAKDENGVERPLCLIRSLPATPPSIHYNSKYCKDLRRIVAEEIYMLGLPWYKRIYQRYKNWYNRTIKRWYRKKFKNENSSNRDPKYR